MEIITDLKIPKNNPPKKIIPTGYGNEYHKNQSNDILLPHAPEFSTRRFDISKISP